MGELNQVHQIDNRASYHWTTAVLNKGGMFDNIINYYSPMIRPAVQKLHQSAKQMNVTHSKCNVTSENKV